MQPAPTWQNVMLRDLPACPCVERKDGRDYARVTCPDCNGAGVARAAGEREVLCVCHRCDNRRCIEFARELERRRCLDAIIHAWNDLAGRCLAEGRPMRSSDLPAFRDDIRARIVADERPITRAQLRELAAKAAGGKAAT